MSVVADVHLTGFENLPMAGVGRPETFHTSITCEIHTEAYSLHHE
jgi:hypothetical protein